ncbi:MAG: hypothetical protein ABW217_13285 [Polyangiaceae bacterium]
MSHDPRLELSEPGPGRSEGRFDTSERELSFSAESPRQGLAEVTLAIDGARFDARFDFAAGEVMLDGHDAALDRGAHGVLLEAAEVLATDLDADAALEQRALYAAIVAWQQAGGVPLSQKRFALRQSEQHTGLDEPLRDKSLLDDGVTCLARGETYAVSFDHGDASVIDEPIVADGWECNGLCGPYCTELTPWRMWTLDCLEHDQCCRATDTPDCWAPLGECGDEYEAAIADFLRGFDPFARHCGG